MRLSAYPARLSRGHDRQRLPSTRLNTRTAKVRVELDNPDGIMTVGMFATAMLVSPSLRGHLIVLPSRARCFGIHDADWVFVQRWSEPFRRVGRDRGHAGNDERAGPLKSR